MDGIPSSATAADLATPAVASATTGILAGYEARAPRVAAQPRSEAAKRAMDVLLAGALIVVLLPVMALAALAIRLMSGPQVVIGHTRVGRGGVPFRCLKFRSMVRDADRVLAEHLARDATARAEWRERRKLARDPRITPLGHFLRRSSIDELPQLFNVLRGEMSLIGPRPVVAAELEQHYVGEAAALYCAVRPGLTGLWQVSGRSGLTYRDRVRLDMEYVRRGSLLLDLGILFRTPLAVLRARGAC